MVKKILPRLLAELVALSLLLGGPAARLLGWSLSGDVDAVTSASLTPEAPSGRYVVLINRSRHPDTLEQWEAFFREEDYGVLLEDAGCLTIEGDAGGMQLAERYEARLVKDQLQTHADNGVLVASRLEAGAYDLAVFSVEAGELWGISRPEDAAWVEIRGEETP